MKSNQAPIDPRGRQFSAILRLVGLSLATLGAILTIIGLVSFFSAFGTFGPPRHFWCAIVGLPLFGVGLQISGLGFLGSFTRYVSGQTAPVHRDTFNYLARGTSAGVRTIAEAAASGFTAGARDETAPFVACSRCQASNPRSAHFCDQCGASLDVKTCPRCQGGNDPDARFCNQCGCQLA